MNDLLQQHTDDAQAALERFFEIFDAFIGTAELDAALSGGDGIDPDLRLVADARDEYEQACMRLELTEATRRCVVRQA